MTSAIGAILPELDGSLKKGDAGRVLIVGGGFEYTGAPYFAAMAAMKMGVDLAHVICHEQAGTAIKSYSPDLIVHPLISSSEELQVDKIFSVLERVDSVIVGPGLSRDPLMQTCGQKICEKAVELGLPIVLDGDGIDLLIHNDGEWAYMANHNLAVTPNHRELKRLLEFYNLADDDYGDLARRLGNAVIVAKGYEDLVADGKRLETATVEYPGCPKRCGGQGDILAGCIGAYLAWNQKAKTPIDPFNCCIAACKQVRLAASACYRDKRRSMLASDLLEYIGSDYE